jgi:predicted RNA-binding Zn-ribbon protein involved in translation (DUF1610 family)
MGSNDITHPDRIPATCTDCREIREFRPVSANTVERTVEYQCPECDHSMVLAMDP